MLLRLFDLLGVGRRDITAAHLQAILHLTRDTLWGRESRVDLPQGVTARYCREWLILETRPQLLTEVQLLQECPVAWGDYRITLLDHREGEGLALRPWRQGERMGLTVGPCGAGRPSGSAGDPRGRPQHQTAVHGPPDLPPGAGPAARPSTREDAWRRCGGWAWIWRLQHRRGSPAGSFRLPKRQRREI